ncbi:MAG: bifunctional DNA-formamidopyrimidine glycosylase/DNA-(apurinic or apyrimidinic site) lyase [Acidimicrobiales bacterium]
MPELPEVETIRAQLAPAVTGRTIVDAHSHPSPKFSPAIEAVGSTIESVGRRGKYLVMGLDDDRELVVHLGMTGRLRVVESSETPADVYVRAWWTFDDGDALEFNDVRRFGRIAVVERGRYESLPTLARLGPEPFSAEFTPDHLWRTLRTSSARIKTQLLGQRVVAGVGNIYADEALWRSGVDPGARTLSRRRAVDLHRAIVDVLAEGIEHGGTTLRDYRDLDGGTGTNQLRLQCYGRAGEPCARCGDLLARRIVDGRGTTVCRTCQRR